MSVSGTDLVEYLSAVSGSAGGAITGSSVTSGVSNNVNPDEPDTALATGGIDYRKTYWKNTHATDPAVLPVIYAEVLPTNITLSLGIGINSADDADPLQGNMTAFGAAAKLALVSDGVDVRVATIIGLDNSGSPVPVSEAVTLTGATEVLSVNTYTKALTCSLSALSGTRIVTLKQGSLGTTRGTIGINKKCCWLWNASPGPTKASGIHLPNLAAAQNYAVWRKSSWAAAAGAVRPNTQTITIEEDQ